MKLLRIIFFDQSDSRIFEQVARPDEWAIPGGFEFLNLHKGEVSGKTRQAFSNGFLGLESFGRATFATVATASDRDIQAQEQALAAHFVARYGAPDMASALPPAREELAFVRGLCADVPINTVFTLRRRFDRRGEIREEFRIITPPGNEPLHARIWKVVDNEP